MKGFGEKLVKAREALEMTQGEVASRIPMNQSNYSKIERDLQEPSLEQLRQLCSIFRLDSNYLLGVNNYSDITESDLQLLRDIRNYLDKRND